MYCEPTNAGRQSEPQAVAKRLAVLLETLDAFSWAICRGEILDDIKSLRNKIADGLKSDGYYWTYDGGDRLKMYEPGSKTGARKKAEREQRLRS